MIRRVRSVAAGTTSLITMSLHWPTEKATAKIVVFGPD